MATRKKPATPPPLPKAGEGQGEREIERAQTHLIITQFSDGQLRFMGEIERAQTHLIITSAREGFRRAGRAWSRAPTRINAADFTPEQLNALALEPMLTVTESPLPQAGEG